MDLSFGPIFSFPIATAIVLAVVGYAAGLKMRGNAPNAPGVLSVTLAIAGYMLYSIVLKVAAFLIACAALYAVFHWRRVITDAVLLFAYHAGIEWQKHRPSPDLSQLMAEEAALHRNNLALIRKLDEDDDTKSRMLEQEHGRHTDTLLRLQAPPTP